MRNEAAINSLRCVVFLLSMIMDCKLSLHQLRKLREAMHLVREVFNELDAQKPNGATQ